MKYDKKDLLKKEIKHIDIKKFNSVPLIDSFDDMAFQSRNLARACQIYDTMLKDKDCAVMLCLAGSLVSAGLKKVIIDLIEKNMVDVIISTGAIVVDQDFFEGLGFKSSMETAPMPPLTWDVLSKIPIMAATMAGLFGTVAWSLKRREKSE